MFDSILTDLEQAERNLDIVWRRACTAKPYPYPEKNSLGLYAGGNKVSTAEIQQSYIQYMSKLGHAVQLQPDGTFMEFAQWNTNEPMPNETADQYFARTGTTYYGSTG